MLLQFHEEAVRAEDVVIPVHAAHGFFGRVVQQGPRDLGRHAARGADQPFGVRRQKVVVDAGIIVEALQLRRGGDLEQVLVAGLVLGQQQQVIGGPVQLGVAVLHAARRHVGFQPDDRLDAGFFGRLVEVDHAEHRAVVGDGHRRHIHLFDALDQLLDVREAVEQRVFGMDVKMGEGHGWADD